jgi:hypothetical protein
MNRPHQPRAMLPGGSWQLFPHSTPGRRARQEQTTAQPAGSASASYSAVVDSPALRIDLLQPTPAAQGPRRQPRAPAHILSRRLHRFSPASYAAVSSERVASASCWAAQQIGWTLAARHVLLHENQPGIPARAGKKRRNDDHQSIDRHHFASQHLHAHDEQSRGR